MGQDLFWGHDSFWGDALCSWWCGREHDTFPRVILFFGIFGTVESSHASTSMTSFLGTVQNGGGGGIQHVNLKAITHKIEDEGVGGEGSMLQCVAMCCNVLQCVAV